MPFISMHAHKVEMTSDIFTVLGKIVRAKCNRHSNKPINNLTLSAVYQVSDVDFEPLNKSLFVIIRTSSDSDYKYVQLTCKELEGMIDLSKMPLETRKYYFMLDYRLYIKEEDTYYSQY